MLSRSIFRRFCSDTSETLNILYKMLKITFYYVLILEVLIASFKTMHSKIQTKAEMTK